MYECGETYRQTLSRPLLAKRIGLVLFGSAAACAPPKRCRVPTAGTDSPMERHGLQQGHPVVPHLVVGHHRQQSARSRQLRGVATTSPAVSSFPRGACPHLIGATGGCFAPRIVVAPLALATLETIHASGDGYLRLVAALPATGTFV